MIEGSEYTEHNRAYEQLVSNDEDLIGLIAYALYKKDKRDFFLGWREQHGAQPSADHVKAFTATVLTLGQQLRYRTAARDMIDAYAKTVSDAEKPLIEKSAVADRLEQAARRVEETGRWYRQIPAGIVAALVFSGIVVLAVIGLGYAGIDAVPTMEQATSVQGAP
jgi:hypothetical protein